jgi:ABC-type antimicrobial peptide transport system permease subunit
LLFEMPSFNVAIAAASAGVLILVVLGAALLPSQRAARVSPIEALRDD